MVKNEGGCAPRPSDAPKPPMQVPEPEDSGPRLKVEALILNTFPENVMETGVLKSQGTGQTSISRSIGETTQSWTYWSRFRSRCLSSQGFGHRRPVHSGCHQ